MSGKFSCSRFALTVYLYKMNFPLPIKAVVIDLDGTLIHTAPDLAHAAELMMADLGRPCPSLETISSYIGNGVSRLVKRVLTGEMDAEPDAALFEQAIAVVSEALRRACVAAFASV